MAPCTGGYNCRIPKRYGHICILIMFLTQSDMAIPIGNVWQMLARATRVIFSHITLVALWVPLGHECYCHGANALMIDEQHKEFKMKDIVPVACKMLAWNLNAARADGGVDWAWLY